jgi:hypothetical protein
MKNIFLAIILLTGCEMSGSGIGVGDGISTTTSSTQTDTQTSTGGVGKFGTATNTNTQTATSSDTQSQTNTQSVSVSDTNTGTVSQTNTGTVSQTNTETFTSAISGPTTFTVTSTGTETQTMTYVDRSDKTKTLTITNTAVVVDEFVDGCTVPELLSSSYSVFIQHKTPEACQDILPPMGLLELGYTSLNQKIAITRDSCSTLANEGACDDSYFASCGYCAVSCKNYPNYKFSGGPAC